MEIAGNVVDKGLTALIDKGVLGIILVLALAALVFMFRLYHGSMMERVREGQAQTAANEKTANALMTMSRLIEALSPRRGH